MTRENPRSRPHVVEVARGLLSRGFAVIPVPRGSKNPGRTSWQKLRLRPEQLEDHFKDPDGNVGILLGEPSGGVVDIDLDDPLAVQLAEKFLPSTPAIFGRASKPRSHWLYRAKGAIKTQQFKLPAPPGEESGDMVVELRSTGCQTVAPGSVHPSGERVEWDADGEPAEVDSHALEAAVVALYREVLSQRGVQEAPPTKSRLAIGPLVELLSRLKGVTPSANGYSARCPAHDDRNPSLSVSTGDDGRVLLHCHAGCSAESVVSAIGLTMAALHPSRKRERPERRGGCGRDRDRPRLSSAQRLVEMVLAIKGLELFHDSGVPYVTLPVEQHLETWPLQGPSFRLWLAAAAHRLAGCTSSAQSLKSAIDTLAGRALFESRQQTVYTRIAGTAGQVFLDLGDALWRVVRVDATGWTVMSGSECPVRFIRPPGLLTLPEPQRGGSVEELRPLLNLRDDDQWTLSVGWLLSTFRPDGPYAALVLCGEAGSCKSTLCKLLRWLVDPNTAGERRLPREERDFFIAARNGRVLSYNNIDGMPPHFSDALCSVLTEGSHAVRVNFADADEVLFSGRRPVTLNGITCSAVRPDLLDRSIVLTLDRLSDDRRRDERSILDEFDRVQPRVLGALLDAVACALCNVGRVRLAVKPRIADVAIWVTAAAGALGWSDDRFVDAVQRNRAEAHADVVEGSYLASAITQLVQHDPWEGTAIELIRVLQEARGGLAARELPRDPGTLTRELRALVLSLRTCGVEVLMPTRPEGHNKRRIIRIRSTNTMRGETQSGSEDAARAAPAARVRRQNSGAGRRTSDHAGSAEDRQPE